MQADLFVERARSRWNRLAALLDEAEDLKSRAFGRAKLEETLRLYRQAGSDLAQARALTSRQEILDPLNDLVSRGHRILYPPGDVRLRENVGRFFAHDLPGAFRRRWRAIAIAATAMLSGALVGAGAVMVDPANAARLVPPTFYTESPQERVQKIESGEERIETLDDALTFGASLYAHNIRVSFLAFGLAAVTGVGGIAILFVNGVLLGAVAASYALNGVSTFFVAWVGPHGALELPAIVFGGAAGFVLARALYLPHNRTLAASLRDAVPDVSRILTAVVLQLLLAGLVEGSFSQFSRSTFSYGFKISVAATLFLSLILYLFLPRRERGER